MSEKRFALQKKSGIRKGDGLDFPSFIQFTAGTIPTVFDNFHGTLQEAFLFTEEQLAHIRHSKQGKTTRELIEEQLPEYVLVEVKISLAVPTLQVSLGDYMAKDIESQLNEQGYTLGAHKGMVNKLNDALKILHFSFTSLTPEMEQVAMQLEKKVFEHAEPLSSAKTMTKLPEAGDLIYVLDVNTKEKTYSTVSKVVEENGEVKVFDEGGFNYLHNFTLVCKAQDRMDELAEKPTPENLPSKRMN